MPTTSPGGEHPVIFSRGKTGRELIEEHRQRVQDGTVREPPKWDPINWPADRGKKVGGPGGNGHE